MVATSAWKHHILGNMKITFSVVFVLIAVAMSGCFLTGKRGGKGDDDFMVRTVPMTPIHVGGYCGFVDFNGKVRIEPRFMQVGTFTEGRAPARIGGRYGYIDTNGTWLLQPVYDYATDVSEGISAVWLNGVTHVIDTLGNSIHTGRYEEVKRCYKGLFEVVVSTTSPLFPVKSLVSREGVVLAPAGTKYFILDSARIIVADRAVGDATSTRVWNLIDDTGDTIETFHGFDEVVSTSGAPLFALRKSTQGQESTVYELYSIDGEHITTLKGDDKRIISIRIAECGHIILHTTEAQPKRSESKSQYLLADHEGKLLDIPASEYNLYSYGSRFVAVRTSGTSEYLVVECNDGEHTVTKESTPSFDRNDYFYFDPSDNGFFRNGQEQQIHAVIKRSDSLYVMNRSGRISARLELTNDHMIVYVSKNLIYTRSYLPNERLYHLSVFGWNAGPKPINVIRNVSHTFGLFENGASVLSEGRQLVLDSKGQVVWKSDSIIRRQSPIAGYDYMPVVVRTGDQAVALPLTSGQLPKHLRGLNLDSLNLRTDPIHVYAFDDTSSSTIDVCVVNQGDTACRMDAQDRRLYLVMEARRDESEEWRPIELLPNSWCGNSYHAVDLPARSYWRFSVERYKGDTPVECRMRLTIRTESDSDTADGGRPRIIYSNSFQMSINPAQFWRKETYTPTDVMDPH